MGSGNSNTSPQSSRGKEVIDSSNLQSLWNKVFYTVGGAIESVSGANAIDPTKLVTYMTTTGADAFTLADGSFVGQFKIIKMVGYVGDGTLTPTNFADGTSLVFSAVLHMAILQWDGTNWQSIYSTAAIS